MLFLYCARIVPFIGLGIIVVHSMIMKFFKFLLAVLLFFTPFDAAFYIMEPDWPSVLKIFAGGVKNSSAKTLFDNYKYMGLILMFYIIVCLAVTDMNEAIKIAKRNQLCLRIKTILWVESIARSKPSHQTLLVIVPIHSLYPFRSSYQCILHWYDDFRMIARVSLCRCLWLAR
uniref:Uncharacterized protein n=1 Tax=Acrobeloides nanus TaxID=290746 RepID=A0A914DGM7_9BILA